MTTALARLLPLLGDFERSPLLGPQFCHLDSKRARIHSRPTPAALGALFFLFSILPSFLLFYYFFIIEVELIYSISFGLTA